MTSDAELQAIIAGGEGDRVEFTETTRDLDKFRKAICAFANDLPDHKMPGFLFIGMKDDGTCAGTEIHDELLRTVAGLRNDGKILPFPSMTVNKRTLDGCDIAVVQVEPSDNPPVKVDGRCWIRTGPRRAQATAEEERRLTEKRRWGNLSYDMQGVTKSTVEYDLDMDFFEKEYLPNAVSSDVLAENDRPRENQLQALRLTTQDGMPTVTAILVLGKDPRYWFPCAYIQFVRYEGTEVTSSILDHKELHGTMSKQLNDLDAILKINISTAMDRSGVRHKESPDYPFEALRELARNAVIHRTYEDANTPVRVNWFADRVEIISPGSVFGTVTSENFGSPGSTSYRNPTIAEAMRNMGFMERFGTGIATARRVLQDNGNPLPQFDAKDTFIIATVAKQQ